MFAFLFRVVPFVVYNIRIRYYAPTALGRWFGCTPRWTLTVFDESYGLWLDEKTNSFLTVGEEHTLDGEEFKISAPLLRLTYSLDWRGDLKQLLDQLEYDIYGVETRLMRDGTARSIQPPLTSYEPELPAVD